MYLEQGTEVVIGYFSPESPTTPAQVVGMSISKKVDEYNK